jgi:hypothetical protein
MGTSCDNRTTKIKTLSLTAVGVDSKGELSFVMAEVFVD